MRGYLLLGFFGVMGVLNGVALTPDALMCGLLAKPGLVAVTDAAPGLSWCFKAGLPGDFQTAYQIQAATSTERFKKGVPDLWDTGKIVSGQSLYVAYAGQPLPAGKMFSGACACGTARAS